MSRQTPLALAFPLRGSQLIEASAGTGKTFTISALYLRLVLGHGGPATGFGRELLPPQILVVTFTDAATKELRERIRTRLAEAARFFRDEIPAPDSLIAQLRDEFDEARWPGCANRLDIAAQWMDEAAVSTIHSWCQRMLREHAFDSGSLFTQTLETDHSELLGEVLRDYWRLFCYSMQGEALNWVRTHWGGPAALLPRVRGLFSSERESADGLELPSSSWHRFRSAVPRCSTSRHHGGNGRWSCWRSASKALPTRASTGARCRRATSSRGFRKSPPGWMTRASNSWISVPGLRG